MPHSCGVSEGRTRIFISYAKDKKRMEPYFIGSRNPERSKGPPMLEVLAYLSLPPHFMELHDQWTSEI